MGLILETKLRPILSISGEKDEVALEDVSDKPQHPDGEVVQRIDGHLEYINNISLQVQHLTNRLSI